VNLLEKTIKNRFRGHCCRWSHITPPAVARRLAVNMTAARSTAAPGASTALPRPQSSAESPTVVPRLAIRGLPDDLRQFARVVVLARSPIQPQPDRPASAHWTPPLHPPSLLATTTRGIGRLGEGRKDAGR
jgi:hypothetical protein